MIPTTESYKKLLQNKIIPKIYVEIQDKYGESIWTDDVIQSFSYERYIDPTGQTLPFMRLQWNEIYTGEFDRYHNPVKYSGNYEYKRINLVLKQSLSFRPTWAQIYDEKKTWGDFFHSNKTWHDVFTEAQTEDFVMLPLYIESKPIVNGNVLTWTANDILYYLQDEQSTVYKLRSNFNDAFPVSERIISQSFFSIWNRDEKIENSNDLVKDLDDLSYVAGPDCNKFGDGDDCTHIFIPYGIKTNGVAKDELIKYFAQFNQFLTFEDVLSNKSLSDIYDFTENDVYIVDSAMESPTYTPSPKIKSYIHRYYRLNSDDETEATTETYIVPEINGEVFEEDNSLNQFSFNDEFAQNRRASIIKYYGEGSFECEILPNIALEPLDKILLPKEIFNESIQVDYYTTILVGIKMEYDGALTQTLELHNYKE